MLGRIGDDRILVAAAWLTILIATTAMIASAMRSDAVARSAILQVLQDAPTEEAALEVAVSAHPEDADQTDAIVRQELARALGSASGTTWASGSSDGYRLAGRGARDVLVFGFAEKLAEHGRLVAGDWPPSQAEPDGTIVVALSSAAASQLGLQLGSQLTVEGRGVDGVAVPIRVGGIYEPIDAADPYWWSDPLALDGRVTERGFTTLGPLMVDRSLVIGRLTDLWSEMHWRTLPDGASIDPGNVGSVAGGVRELAKRISTDLGRKDAAVRDHRAARHPRPCDSGHAVERQRHPAARRPDHRPRRLRADHGRGHGGRAAARIRPRSCACEAPRRVSSSG